MKHFKDMSMQEKLDQMSPKEREAWLKKKDQQCQELGEALASNLNRNVLRKTSVLNPRIRSAIRFSLKTHEVYQKQKRKGKDIPYIIHPLIVGLILAKANAPEDIIEAGILHDTIEDSIDEKKVTPEMIEKRFGHSVADIVDDMTEKNKNLLPWGERRKEALEHIKSMDGPSLWVKTADVISNISELIDDYERDGNEVFERFNASKEKIITNHIAVIHALLKRWKNSFSKSTENPMVADLKTLADDIIKLESENIS